MGWGRLAEGVQAARAEPVLGGGEVVQGILLGTGGPLSITLYPVLLSHQAFYFIMVTETLEILDILRTTRLICWLM